MDRALFVAANAASLSMRAQAANTNNLANATTTGFRAELVSSEAMPLSAARHYSRETPNGFDASDGAMVHTGNPLHIAMSGNHWLEVQAPDATVAYTRAGDLRVNANGQLVNGAGHQVQGENGLLAVPPHEHIQIGADGTVSIVPQGATEGTLVQLDRLRVVEHPPADLERGADGLMRLREGVVAMPATGNVLSTGVVEGANVNTAETLVKMIELSRQFELNVRLMRTVEDNAKAGSRLIQR